MADEPIELAEDLARIIARAEASMRDPVNQARQERFSAHEAKVAAAAAEMLPQEQLAWLRGLGVPLVEAEVALVAEPRGAILRLDRISAKRPVLVLAGNPGSGKTVAAAAYLLTTSGPRLGRVNCIPAAFTTAVNFGRLWPRHGRDKERLVELEEVAELAIDDVGMEEEDIRSRLDHLIYQRAGNRRPTLLTTNLPAQMFRERYEERVWSRLEQFGSYEGLTDPDYRSQERHGHGGHRSTTTERAT